jgi:hypothetical protein
LDAGKSALVLAVVAGAGSGVSAHRLDECLQAARIAVERDHVAVELDVTPGVAVADAIVGEIDRDGDRTLSAGEQQTYTSRVLASLDVTIDGRAVRLAAGAATFPDIAALQRGDGTIRLRAAGPISRRAQGGHSLVFRNRYRPDISVYLANALVPASADVAVTAQERDPRQRELRIGYQVRASATDSRSWWIVGGVTAVLAILLARPHRHKT